MKMAITITELKFKISSLIMLLALAWLTVSLPFVYAGQQAQKETVQNQYGNTSEENDNNPVTNTTEEKTENGTNTLSEYLHDAHHNEHAGCLVVKSYKWHPADLYIAFHPEFICPPPDRLAS